MQWPNNFRAHGAGYNSSQGGSQQSNHQYQTSFQQIYQQPAYYENANQYSNQMNYSYVSPWQQVTHHQQSGYNGLQQFRPEQFSQPQQLRNQYIHQHGGVSNRNSQNNQNYKTTPTKNLPSNNDFSLKCEPCERDFISNAALLAHQKTHVKCEEETCSFVASSKAVKLHFIQTHAEGKFRIRLQTPEEIQKWREERKRNWPTSENILRKKQKHDDDERDGIKIQTKEFSYIERRFERGRGRGRGRGDRNRGRNCRGRNINPDTLPKETKPIPKEGNIDESSKTTTGSQDVQSAVTNTAMNGGGTSSVVVSSSGLSMLQSYTPDASDEEDVNNNAINKKPFESNAVLHIDTMGTEKHAENNMSGKEDGEIESEGETTLRLQATEVSKVYNPIDKPVIQSGRPAAKQAINTRESNRKNKTRLQRSNPSLLEMLLANEIRHERNVTLQCIRFIVKENFFGINTQ